MKKSMQTSNPYSCECVPACTLVLLTNAQPNDLSDTLADSHDALAFVDAELGHNSFAAAIVTATYIDHNTSAAEMMWGAKESTSRETLLQKTSNAN